MSTGGSILPLERKSNSYSPFERDGGKGVSKL
jgi:hypothetical protein